MNVYKIECFTDTGVNVVSEVIKNAGGKCVVEGLAIVTDHAFSESELNEVRHCVGNTSSDITQTDVCEFMKVK